MANEQREFWSTVAQKYDQVVDLQIGALTRSMVRERAGKEGRLGKLAEFGCGTGFYTQVLVGKADTVIATDISPGMLALAQERIKAANVTFQVEDWQEASFSAEAFDTTFISLVIHFTEPGKTLAEMRRILKPGGTLIILEPGPGCAEWCGPHPLPDSNCVPRANRLPDETAEGIGKECPDRKATL
jgi:ubiquinone/menaquinone biosynthesis C-methylase UbiE